MNTSGYQKGTCGGLWKTGDSGGSENSQFTPCYTVLICELCEQYDLLKNIHIIQFETQNPNQEHEDSMVPF